MPERALPGQPRLLLCGFGAFPEVHTNPSAVIVEQLESEAWAPEGASIAFAVLPTTWSGAVSTLLGRLRETRADGVLLTGVCGSASAFRVEMRAQNHASTTLVDADGRRCGSRRISPLGPAFLRATAPVEPMIQSIRRAGLPVEASSDAGDYLCNYTFYRALADRSAQGGTQPVAFLHLPPVRAAAAVADVGGDFTLDDLEQGVKAAATCLARTLAFAGRAPMTA